MVSEKFSDKVQTEEEKELCKKARDKELGVLVEKTSYRLDSLLNISFSLICCVIFSTEGS